MTLEAELIETLQTENETLRERVRQLEDTLGLRLPAPLVLELTGKEAQIYGLLLKSEWVSRAAMMAHLYSDRAGDDPDIKIVDVFVCKMRSKLEPFGIIIETVWGQGYTMPPASKRAAAALIQDAAA